MATTPQQHSKPFSPGPPSSALDLVVHNSLLESMWQSYLQRITPAGRWLLVPTFLFGLWGSTSLDHQVHVACLYALSLWGVAALCLPFARPAVQLTAWLGGRIGAGETLAVELEVKRTGGRGGSDLFLMAHGLPAEIVPALPQGVPLPSLGLDETARVTLELCCLRRGAYRLSGFRVSSDFPFGLLCAYRVFGPTRSLLVYPRFVPLAHLMLTTGRRYQPGGAALASSLGDSREFIGSRPFRDGDSVRDIDWPATARLDNLIVREYRQEYSHRAALILDTFVPKGDEARREDFERAVSVVAAVSEYLVRQEFLIDLFAAGADVYHLKAGRSLASIDDILEILACVEATPRETVAQLGPEIDECLSQITTVICVFLDWDAARRQFVERLGIEGATVKVVVVRDENTTVDLRGTPDLGAEVSVVRRDDFERGLQEL